MLVNISFFLDGSLLDGNALGSVEQLRREQLPEWATSMTLVRSPRDKRPVTDFTRDVTHAALERGEIYAKMVARYGKGEFDRKFGSVEIRGATRDVIVVIQLDQLIFAPISSNWFWGNTLTLQFRSNKGRRPSWVEKLRAIAVQGCTTLSAAYAHGYESEEYARKNMDYSNGVCAIGLDISRYLPGVYWFNFFGPAYCDLIGKARLLSTPGQRATPLETGVAVFLAESPSEWMAADYRVTELEVLKHLGAQFFFDRTDLTRPTKAPDFGLPTLPSQPRSP